MRPRTDNAVRPGEDDAMSNLGKDVVRPREDDAGLSHWEGDAISHWENDA